MDVVFFDLDDTLYNQAEPFVRAYKEVFGTRYDEQVKNLEQLFALSRKHSESVFEASERGDMSMEDMYVYRIQRALADFGVEADAQSCLRMHYLYAHNQEHAISLTPTICAVLDWCCANARAGIISNGPADHQLAKMELLGVRRWMPQEAITISSLVGVAKPDPAIFELACKRLGTTPQRCVYVGDSFGPDVAGACSAHMPVVWFDRRGRPATTADKPMFVVHTEEELLELMPSLTQL